MIESIGSLACSVFNPSRPLLVRAVDYLSWSALILLIGVAVLLICRSKRLKEYWHILTRGIFTFEPVNLEVKDFESSGLILDIGGGGEGVIGRLDTNFLRRRETNTPSIWCLSSSN